MDDLTTLGGLFLTAFLAATVFPAQSEILLAALHMSESHSKAVLVSTATAGNVLGSVANWLMGRYLMRFQDRRWFPVKRSLVERATAWYRRWGFWSLLLAWAPIIGDPLTLVAGILRENFWVFVTLVTISKLGRYILVVMAV
jgi:membrane protein YqaA with SNARE-associated domain